MNILRYKNIRCVDHTISQLIFIWYQESASYLIEEKPNKTTVREKNKKQSPTTNMYHTTLSICLLDTNTACQPKWMKEAFVWENDCYFWAGRIINCLHLRMCRDICRLNRNHKSIFAWIRWHSHQSGTFISNIVGKHRLLRVELRTILWWCEEYKT